MTDPETARSVRSTAQRLSSGYYSMLVAHHVAVNPAAINLLPPHVLGGHPIGEVRRKDGSGHLLNMRHYLDLLREDHNLQTEVLRSWAAGTLLALGDALSAHGYFDRAPLLELVYHLRNGVAHGNRFRINDSGRRRLKNHAAHNRNAAVKSLTGAIFEIIPDLSGPILFEYMGPADVIDLIQSVEIYMSRLAGDI